MIRWSQPESALYRMDPPDNAQDARWTLDAQLLATIVDVIQSQTWLYSRAHGSTASAPDRVPRPGVKQRNDGASKQIGADPIPTDQFDEWWAKGYRNG